MGRSHSRSAAPAPRSPRLTSPNIIVRQNWTTQDAKMADVGRAKFNPSKATSAASNVLNMADCGKSVMLCCSDVRRFATPAVLSKYGYRQVKDTKVIGDCDYCRDKNVQCTLFLREDDFQAVWGYRESQRVKREYGAICAR